MLRERLPVGSSAAAPHPRAPCPHAAPLSTAPAGCRRRLCDCPAGADAEIALDKYHHHHHRHHHHPHAAAAEPPACGPKFRQRHEDCLPAYVPPATLGSAYVAPPATVQHAPHSGVPAGAYGDNDGEHTLEQEYAVLRNAFELANQEYARMREQLVRDRIEVGAVTQDNWRLLDQISAQSVSSDSDISFDGGHSEPSSEDEEDFHGRTTRVRVVHVSPSPPPVIPPSPLPQPAAQVCTPRASAKKRKSKPADGEKGPGSRDKVKRKALASGCKKTPGSNGRKRRSGGARKAPSPLRSGGSRKRKPSVSTDGVPSEEDGFGGGTPRGSSARRKCADPFSATPPPPPPPPTLPIRKRRTPKMRVVSTASRRVPEWPVDAATGGPELPLQIGSVTWLISLGEIPEKPAAFHTDRYIWPVGYAVVRLAASYMQPHTGTYYWCTILSLSDGSGPVFRIQAQDDPCGTPFDGNTASGVWALVLKRVNAFRNKQGYNSVSGPEYFGLSYPAVAMMIQDLPGADRCANFVRQSFEVVSPAPPGSYLPLEPAVAEFAEKARSGRAWFPPREEGAGEQEE